MKMKSPSSTVGTDEAETIRNDITYVLLHYFTTAVSGFVIRTS